MLKALGKLTNSKSIPASSNQVNEHKKHISERDKIKQDLRHITHILDNLTKSYADHKKDPVHKRFPALTEMIERSISDLRKYVSGSGDCATSVVKKKTGALDNLLKSAETFAAARVQEASTSSKSQSSIEIERDLKDLEKEIRMLKEKYRQRRDLLESLDRQYNDEAYIKMGPIKKYAETKLMAKSTIQKYQSLNS